MSKEIGHPIERLVEKSNEEAAIHASKRREDKRKGTLHLVPGYPGNLKIFVPAGKSVKKAIEKFTKNYKPFNDYESNFKKNYVQ